MTTTHYQTVSSSKDFLKEKNIHRALVGIKQFVSKINSLGCQLNTEKCPEETTQEYFQVEIFSPVGLPFLSLSDKAPDKEMSKVVKFFPQKKVLNVEAL